MCKTLGSWKKNWAKNAAKGDIPAKTSNNKEVETFLSPLISKKEVRANAAGILCTVMLIKR